MKTVDEIRDDVEASARESDYVAVNTLWVALLRLANEQPGRTEKDRMCALVRRIPAGEAEAIVTDPAVDELLGIDPPLETVLVSPHERNDTENARKTIEAVRLDRTNDPTSALMNLGSLLKRIRNKREHGFKTRHRPRDLTILKEARNILDILCRSALAHNAVD